MPASALAAGRPRIPQAGMVRGDDEEMVLAEAGPA